MITNAEKQRIAENLEPSAMLDTLANTVCEAFLTSDYYEQVDLTLDRDVFVLKYGKPIADAHPLKLAEKIGFKVAALAWDKHHKS